MFKKRIWKPLLIGVGWAICLGGVVVLMSFIEVKKSEVVCKAIKVFIPGNQYFIDRQEVDKILEMSSNTLVGRRIDQINIHDLESKLKVNPFIEFAKVYVDMDGTIQVEISQRQPILRILNRFDQDFYVDQHGLKMPLSQNFTARVLAANGYIDELFANKVDSLHTRLAKDIFRTADYIRRDSLWEAQIAQIYINQEHEIELIPRVGNQRILLGSADSLSLKFNNLKVFYKQALPMAGWDAYKMINIKYANQVIGVKNETLLDSLKTAAKRAAEKADSIKQLTTVNANTDSVVKAVVNDEVEKIKEDKPPAEKTEEIKPIITKPVEGKSPVTNKPTAEKPMTAKPAGAKAVVDKSDKKIAIKK